MLPLCSQFIKLIIEPLSQMFIYCILLIIVVNVLDKCGNVEKLSVSVSNRVLQVSIIPSHVHAKFNIHYVLETLPHVTVHELDTKVNSEDTLYYLFH